MEDHYCKECDKKFSNKEAYEQHIKDKHAQPSTKKRSLNYKYAGLVVLIIIILGSGIFLLSGTRASYDVKTPDEDLVIGSPNATVTITEFSDFQCPFCARFHTQTYPQIKEEYIDTGKAKFVYKHFPLPSHNNARRAAEASECAADMGGISAFEQVSQKMFSNNNFLTESNIISYAKDIGLNSTEFEACLKSSAMSSRVERDQQEGRSVGVSSTPTFFIDGQKIEGAQPFSTFQAAIESRLSAA